MSDENKGLGASAADATDRVGGLRPEPTASSQPSGRSPTGAAFTPGPWRVFYTRDGRTILGVGDRDGGGITDQGDVSTNDQGVWRSGREKEANARLIAAAPDLYSALVEVDECLQAMAEEGILADGTWQFVLDALAKVRG